MWPTETPWPAVVICLAAAAVWLSLAVQRGNGKLAAAGGLCGLLAAAAIGVDFAVETDREQVARHVTELVRAFERGARDDTLVHFSPQALCERAVVEFALQTVAVEAPLSIKDVQVTLQNEASIALSTFRANGTVAVRGRSLGHHPSQWRLTWRRVAGE